MVLVVILGGKQYCSNIWSLALCYLHVSFCSSRLQPASMGSVNRIIIEKDVCKIVLSNQTDLIESLCAVNLVFRWSSMYTKTKLTFFLNATVNGQTKGLLAARRWSKTSTLKTPGRNPTGEKANEHVGIRDAADAHATELKYLSNEHEHFFKLLIKK